MNHIDELTLELYVLGSKDLRLSPGEIEAHLGACAGCRELHGSIRQFYNDLSLERNADAPLRTGFPVPSRKEIFSDPGRSPAPHTGPGYRLREVDIALPVRIARWMVRHPVRAAFGGLGGVGLIAAILIFFPRPEPRTLRDPSPVDYHIRGRMLTFLNRYGDSLRQVEVSRSEAIEIGLDQANRVRRICFVDITGDGVNEIIFASTSSDDRDTVGGQLVCESADGRTEYWRYSTARHFNFPGKPEGNTPEFPIRTMAIGEHDGEDRPALYVLTAHSQFPSYLAKLDARTGRETGLYLHIGHLVNLKVADLDGDGIDEVVMAGVNNDFREACAVVLDSRFITGHAPVREPYIPAGIPPALEKAYVIIPRTIVGEAIAEEGTTIQAKDVQILRESKTIRIDIQEYNDHQEQGTYSLIFDYLLRPLNYGTYGDYDDLAAKLMQEGRIRRDPDAGYFQEFFTTLRYWDGRQWRDHPVFNSTTGATSAEALGTTTL